MKYDFKRSLTPQLSGYISEGKMGYIKLSIILLCSVASKAWVEGYSSDLESKVDLLSSKIAKLEEENLQIQKRDIDSSNYLAFDCFRNSDLTTYGIITFDDCEGMKLSTLLTKHSSCQNLQQLGCIMQLAWCSKDSFTDH